MPIHVPRSRMKGQIVVISGPTGVGKDTIIDILVREYQFKKIVSYTTREPRKGELDGVHYHFVTLNTFLEMESRGELLDHVVITGNHYGLPAKKIAEQFFLGKRLVFNVVIETARIIKAQYSASTLVFIKAADLQTLIGRLHKRGMSQKQISERFQENPHQLVPPEDFDLVVTNHDNQQSVVADMIAKYLHIQKGHPKP